MHYAVTLSLMLMIGGTGASSTGHSEFEPPCVLAAQAADTTSPFAASRSDNDDVNEYTRSARRVSFEDRQMPCDPMLFAPPVRLPQSWYDASGR